MCLTRAPNDELPLEGDSRLPFPPWKVALCGCKVLSKGGVLTIFLFHHSWQWRHQLHVLENCLRMGRCDVSVPKQPQGDVFYTLQPESHPGKGIISHIRTAVAHTGGWGTSGKSSVVPDPEPQEWFQAAQALTFMPSFVTEQIFTSTAYVPES